MAEVFRAESTKSHFRAIVSNALAAAVITGIDECKENELELKQLQQIHLTKMAVMAYYDAVKEFEDALDITEKLESSRRKQ